MQIRQQGSELVTPLTGKGVAGTHAVAQALGNVFQQFVTFGMSMGVVHQLEAIQVDEQDRQHRVVSFGLGNGQFETVPEQSPVRQMGKMIVQGLKIDRIFGKLAFRDVARHAVRPEVALGLPGCVILGRVTLVNTDGTQHGHHVPVLENPVLAVQLAFQADFQIRRCPMVAAPFVEGIDGTFQVIFVNNGEVRATDQLLPGKAEERLDPSVDEGETAGLVEGVDDVRRTFDKKTMQTLRLFKARRHEHVVPLQPPVTQNGIYLVADILQIVRLAHEPGCTVAHGLDGGIDAVIPAHQNHAGRFPVGRYPLEDFQTRDVGQIYVEQDELDIAAFQNGYCFGTAAAVEDGSPLPRKAVSQTRPYQWLIVDNQELQLKVERLCLQSRLHEAIHDISFTLELNEW